MIRQYRPGDRDAVLRLGTRLTIGVAPWRDPAAVSRAVDEWVVGSIEYAAQGRGTLLVAEDDGRVLGFVSVSERRHFTGELDAYIGELAVAEDAEGGGIGRRLLEHAQRWARERGYQRITLETGARNARALRLYAHLGWESEDVRLSKPLAE